MADTRFSLKRFGEILRLRRPRPASQRKASISCSPQAREMLERAGLADLLDGSQDEIREYTLSPTKDRQPGRLVGIEAWTWGRFGNAIFASINAISAAAHLGLEHVVLCEADGFLSDKSQTWDGMKIYSSRQPTMPEGWLLRGPFWEHLDGWPKVTVLEQRRIALEVMRSRLQPASARPKPTSDELVIHIRGGDVFSGDEIDADYVQPPLAFYRQVVARSFANFGIRHVRIVTEDQRNPCLAALQDHLRANQISHSVQSLSLIDDFMTLVEAETLAFGVGTFGPAACLMSDRVKRIFTFLPHNGSTPKGYPWIECSHVLKDGKGTYIKQGEWRNDPDQRQLMLAYSDDDIVEQFVSMPA